MRNSAVRGLVFAFALIAPGFLAGQELGASGFIEPADPAPKIEFPGRIARNQKVVHCRAAIIRGHRAGEGVFTPRDATLIIKLREKAGPSLGGDGTGLLHARNRNSNIIAVRQRGAEEVLQGWIFEEFPPRQVGKGVGGGRGRSAAKLFGLVEGGPFVVGTDGATGQEKEPKGNLKFEI